MHTPNHLFIRNRRRLTEQLLPASAVIMTSNDHFPSNADGTIRFIPHVSLYYLTGIQQEDTLLLLCPDHPDPALREVLFIRRVNQQFTQWLGDSLTRETASEISGIATVFYADEFAEVSRRVVLLTDHIYLYTNEHLRSENRTQTREDRLLLEMKATYPLHQYHRLYPLLARLRTVKSEEEIALLQRAADITEAGFRRLLRFVKPGVREKQIEAEMIHEYLQHDGYWADYSPIVASGRDSCILHYHANNKVCKDGDVLLIDAAASWQYYNADLTRTIPVNGRYSPRQRQYYDAVLRVHRKMKAEVKAGVYIKSLFGRCNELLLEELTGLGLCSMDDIRRDGARFYLNKYCYHNFSHFLGLDVHDTAYFDEPLPAGAVITNEPGIYNVEEGIGVRIENDLVITAGGCMDLMERIPIEAEEIELLMQAS